MRMHKDVRTHMHMVMLTSLLEVYVANMLATKFRREDMQDFLRRCREIDRTHWLLRNDMRDSNNNNSAPKRNDT
jgi:hypothetical protein